MLTNSELEKLLHNHMRGVENFVSYRQKRLLLIRAFVNKVSSDITIPQNNSKDRPDDPLESTIRKSEFEIPKLASEEKSSFSKLVTLIALCVLIAIAGATWKMSESSKLDTEHADSSHSTESSGKAPQNTLIAPIANEYFLDEFLSLKNWDSETLSNFLMQWQALPKARRSALRQTPTFIAIGEEIKQRMQTISTQKNITSNKQQRVKKLLLWFATELSLGVR